MEKMFSSLKGSKLDEFVPLPYTFLILLLPGMHSFYLKVSSYLAIIKMQSHAPIVVEQKTRRANIPSGVLLIPPILFTTVQWVTGVDLCNSPSSITHTLSYYIWYVSITYYTILIDLKQDCNEHFCVHTGWVFPLITY